MAIDIKALQSIGDALLEAGTANAIDFLSFIYDGTNYFWQYGRNFT